MEIKEFRGFAVKKIDSYRVENLEPIGFINREIQVNANLGVKNIINANEYIMCHYECKFDFNDAKTKKNMGYIYAETETFIRFENNKKVIDMWNKDKSEFNKIFAQNLGNYHFMELIPIISLILQRMQLPIPIPSPFVNPAMMPKSDK